jgi:protein SCO1/2
MKTTCGIKVVLVRSLVGCLLALLVACSSPSFEGTALPPRPAPNFTLVDQYGRHWTLSEQHGSTVALYFGYTHCTDDCPLTLAKLSHALASLHGRGEVAFVTVDPARDTPARLREYLRRFHGAAIAGLTGGRVALARVYRAYGVWAQALARRRDGSYDVAHATPVFLIDARGMLRVVHNDDDPRSAFVHDLRALGA